MKAIYINLDPYLQAAADWLNAGKPGTAPSFNPLPLAVTIPLGETAAIYWAASGEADESPEALSVTVDGQSLDLFGGDITAGEWPEGTIATNVEPGLSSLAPSAKYAVVPVSEDSVKYDVSIGQGDFEIRFVFTVLVRRETASGPVDLVEFTPPAAAPTLTADAINTALGGTGAQEGTPLAGVNIDYALYGGNGIVVGVIDGKDVLCVGNS